MGCGSNPWSNQVSYLQSLEPMSSFGAEPQVTYKGLMRHQSVKMTGGHFKCDCCNLLRFSACKLTVINLFDRSFQFASNAFVMAGINSNRNADQVFDEHTHSTNTGDT